MTEKKKKSAGILTAEQITEAAENQVRTDKTEDACQSPEWPDGWDPEKCQEDEPIPTPRIMSKEGKHPVCPKPYSH